MALFDQTVDANHGGIETTFALSKYSSVWKRAKMELSTCKEQNGLEYARPTINPECVQCHLFWGLATGLDVAVYEGGTAIAAGAGAAGAATTAMMSRYLAYAGSAVGTFLGKAWDCGKWCAVGNYNMNAIECVDLTCRSGSSQSACQGCFEQLKECCRTAGGHCATSADFLACTGSTFPSRTARLVW